MSDPQGKTVNSARDVTPVALDWGELRWLVGNEQMPGARQTFGVVTIHPGKRNPLHLHPNCEELLYVLEGEADHRLGDEMYHLGPGDVIRIPQGVPHWARAIGDSPVVAVISFSSGDRQTENLDSGDDLA
jgi:quercetin dioxygenase-like cupin family protein